MLSFPRTLRLYLHTQPADLRKGADGLPHRVPLLGRGRLGAVLQVVELLELRRQATRLMRIFAHHFCQVRRPTEKGHTENIIVFARRNFLTPVLRKDHREALNDQLERLYHEDLERKLRGQPANKAPFFAEEQAALLPLPKSAFEARRRRFHEAGRRVFIGDGLPWNWSIWKEHFCDFTPILDFIHAVQYLYAAAEAWESTDLAGWSRYVALAEVVWQGRVADVLDSLQMELAARGIHAAEDLPENSPHAPLVDATRYLDNNRQRMDYPRYRREGLPLTSSPMESLIKQINHRVRGTEMFWNSPTGAEAILQRRAAHLCEDGRLEDYLRSRPGCPYVRRPELKLAA